MSLLVSGKGLTPRVLVLLLKGDGQRPTFGHRPCSQGAVRKILTGMPRKPFPQLGQLQSFLGLPHNGFSAIASGSAATREQFLNNI